MVKENVNFRVAAKAFILNKNREMLLIRRRLNDVMKPGIWEIPGGRMDPGENPFIGLKREAKEEVDLDIDIKKPFSVKHFDRSDGQTITMICFECYSANKDVKLSEEHIDFGWFALEEAKEKITPFLKNEVETLIS